jgi:SAM-dependent methyltransferase
MSMLETPVRIFRLLRDQIGIDPTKTLWFVLELPRYVRDFLRFRSGYAGRIELLPCLHDWHEEGGSTKDEYFWQDLLVAKMIFAAKPEKHVDVGSLLGGFVAHVASFRELEVFDVRPISAKIPGVTFTQADLMKPVPETADYCDSLSCLHALEHFGLGRYGDAIDPRGFEFGFANMAALLRRDGVFYLSVPLGIERVVFNAHRIFDPRSIIGLAMQHGLSLSALTLIRPGGRIEAITPDDTNLSSIANQRYALGLFVFQKSPR